MPALHSDRTGRRPRPRAAFTLAELLAVMAIVGIMIAVAAPALVGLSRGASLRGATAQLKSGLSLARQYAITRRQMVYVLFPVWANDSQPIDPSRSKAFHAYAMCTLSNNIPFFLTDWTFLPQGVIIHTNSDIYPGGAAYTCTNFPANQGLLSPSSVPVLRFKTDGSVQSGEFYIHINLNEGYITSNGTPTTKSNSFTNQLTVNGLTGTVKVE
ncbi:MAG: prepilin-type N-terminal cleavage/methylation domain-containing protein [Kiritimatiellaeota bacterium]|nr:prepilin-type N-terminal cleavage/methylation domain-containing protein [Kiritimatiellota bacterium]